MQNMLYLFYVKITIFSRCCWPGSSVLCKRRKINVECFLIQGVDDSWVNSILKRLWGSFIVVCQKNMEKTGCF